MKKTLRIVGLLEAISFLLLLCVAMPMKYLGGHLEATRIPGSIHGFLFLAYLVLVFKVSDDENWPASQTKWGFVASVLPFGTLVFDHKFLRK